MIRFCCEQCGHRLKVPDQSAGRRGKCPKCGNNVIVPDKSITIVLKCGSCGLKIGVPRTHAGKKGRCPNCKNPITVPAEKSPVPKPERNVLDDTNCLFGNDVGLTLLEVPEELKLADEKVRESSEIEAAIEQRPNLEEQLAEDEQAESDGRRKLPWFIDIFLYPVSTGGLSTITIIVLLQFLTNFAAVFLACCMCLGGLLSLIVKILFVYSYMYWYFSECIRDSAEGGLRAPEIIGIMPGLGDMFWQFLRLFMCFAFFLGPVTFYRGYVYLSDIEMSSLVFWTLLTYGIFFFPMGTLSVVMFGSVNGLNPILIIRSIASVLIRYLLLVVLVYSLTVIFIISYAKVKAILPGNGMVFSIILTYISFALSIYALLIVGHLLGRFYYNYQDKLNWEV